MTRPAGRLTFALALSLIATGGAFAADLGRGDYGYDDRCGPPELVTTSYQEQICYAGSHGYAACRWVDRAYTARIPAECGRSESFEDAHKIPRRPMFGHGVGLVTKG